jgi:hypothetical protein
MLMKKIPGAAGALLHARRPMHPFVEISAYEAPVFSDLGCGNLPEPRQLIYRGFWDAEQVGDFGDGEDFRL